MICCGKGVSATCECNFCNRPVYIRICYGIKFIMNGHLYEDKIICDQCAEYKARVSCSTS